MRSIRRSITSYLFLLIAATLAVVWVVIDRVTARALSEREATGAELIHARYEERRREELIRTDQTLLDRARMLGNIMQERFRERYVTRFNEEATKFIVARGAVQLSYGTSNFGFNPLGQAAWTATGNSWFITKPNPLPGQLFWMYFASLPIPDDYIQHLDDENQKNDYYQINTLAGREWHSASLGTRKLPFDPKEIDGNSVDPGKPAETENAIDWTIGTTYLGSDQEPIRRVVYKMPHLSASTRYAPRPRPPSTPGSSPTAQPSGAGGGGPAVSFGGPARSIVGAWASWATSGSFGPAPTPPWFGQQPQPAPPVPTTESLPRLYIQCARPQAVIDAQVALFAVERDQELGKLTEEVRKAHATLRLQLAGIGILAFLAVAIGGPFFVGRGLRPVGKLSDAVSRVSEKDFNLPHDGTELAAELAPIHARLTQTLDLLRRAFSREKQAVADISHELRTPIAALMATIDVTLRKPRTPEQYRATLEECRLISKQLSQLVERIMTLASLDAGNDRIELTHTDATELVTGCAAVIRPLAAMNSISVQVRVSDPLELETDPGKLREILMNLLHNAVEYNQPNGTIEVTARREGDTVSFEIRDTGIGMTPEVRDKIFERFYRADASRRSTGVHAGLGLAIVKEYVSLLNGTITVESEPGSGSLFRVVLPAPLVGPQLPHSASQTTPDVPAAVG